MGYTDAGLLSMAIQALIGASIAIPVYIFLLRKRIGDWLNGLRKRNQKGPGEL